MSLRGCQGEGHVGHNSTSAKLGQRNRATKKHAQRFMEYIICSTNFYSHWFL